MDKTFEFLTTLLNPTELAAVQSLADNVVALEAIKKIVLASVYNGHGTIKPSKQSKPLINAALSLVANPDANKLDDAAIGRDLRAMWQGIILVEKGFENLSKFKTGIPSPVRGPNKAR